MSQNHDLCSRPSTEAVVVLGCTVRLDARDHLVPSALLRRIDFGARVWHEADRGRGPGSPPVCVASGGRHWAGALEADVMARELERRGVPPRAIVRERCSLTTVDNARFCAALLERRGLHRVRLVTCEWHVRRAVALFERAGLEVDAVAVGDAAFVPWRRRLWRAARERVWTWADAQSADGRRTRAARAPAPGGPRPRVGGL